MIDAYFTLILTDNYGDNDRWNVVNKIVLVKPGFDIHWIIEVIGEPKIHYKIDLGYYTHKPIESNLFKLIAGLV